MGHKKRIPVPVISGGSSPMVGLRSSRGGTPHAPHVVGQVGAPIRKPSLSMPSSGPISSGVPGQVSPVEGVSIGDSVNKAAELDATVQNPVTVNVESWPQHIPQHQPQPQQHSAIPTLTLSPPQPFPRALSGSVNLPVGHSADASTTLPLGSVHVKARGGSMHVPSVGLRSSLTNSTTQQQISSLMGSGGGSLIQERVVASSPIPSFRTPPLCQSMPSGKVWPCPAPAPVYMAGTAVTRRSSMQHKIAGGNLTRSIGRQWCPPNRSRSLERLGATVSPSSQARQVSGMPLSRAATAGTTSTSTMSGTASICQG